MKNIVLSLLMIGFAPAANAHPHVFVQAQIEILTDQSQRMTGVRLTWIYDDYFSLLLTADLGIDLDGDLVLTPEEEATLEASVLDWPPDYEGDLYITQGDLPLPLGPKQDHTAAMVDGLIHETHTRMLVTPAGHDSDIQLQVFDPYFYVAYEIAGDIHVTGGDGCTADLQKVDLDAAYAMVEALLGGKSARDVGPDEEFPMVGQSFADTVVISCVG